MKQKKVRLLGLLLAAVMLLGCLPVQALAAEGGWFYLAADWNGTLLIAPERISYTADQTLYEALNASGHSFGPDENSVTKIDGKTGNFIRSDETGSHDLTRNAAQAGIRYLCFTDRLTAQPSDAMQSLIAAMADYRLEEPDVQLAAKVAYNAACAGYVTADDNAALSLYTALHNAVEQYKQTLDGQKYNVTFSDRNSVWSSGDTLYAENQYGRVYQDENGSGMLSLPAGSYTFTMQAQSGGVTGSVTVPEQTSVTAVLDRTDWLKADGFMLSSASKTEFDGSKLPVEKKTARELTAVLDDSFTGTLYAFWPYDTSVFPDASKLKLTAIYTPAGGTEPQQAEQALKSRTSGVDGVLAVGMQGNTVVYRADTQDAQGMTQYQDYTLTIRRAPTLKQLRVTEESGAPAALESFDESTRTYTWQVLSEQVTLALTPTAEGYTLFADGEDVTQTGGCTLSIDETEKSVSIEVRAGGETTQYTLVLKKTNSCTVRIPVESADVDLTVCDANGQTVKGVYVAAANQYRFTLVPGMQYTYTATKDTYYHTTGSFTAKDGPLSKVTVQTGDWLTELALSKDNLTSSKGSIPLDQTFDPASHAYTAAVADTPAAVYLCINGDIQTGSTAFLAQYRTITNTAQDDQPLETQITSAQLGTPVLLRNLLLNQNGRGNTLTIRCQRTAGNVTYYQEYIVTLRRTLSLRDLSLACAGQAQTLTYGGGTGYSAAVWDYTVTVPAAAQTLSVCAEVYPADAACYRDNGSTGYRVWMDGQELTPGAPADVQLNGTAEPETITLALTNDFAGEETASEYRLQVQKAQPVLFTPQLTPTDALMFVCDTLSKTRVWPDADGAYELFDGYTYQYLLTCPGYAGRSGIIEPSHSASGALVLKIDEDAGVVTGGAARAAMTLSAAQKNETLRQLPAEWADFRGTSYDANGTPGGTAGSNNAVVSIQMPVDADASTLYWSNAIGSGIDSGSTGCPLLVDGGTVSGNPDFYTVESAAITLNQPTRIGYTFTGWSGTNLTGEDNLTVTIPTGSIGNRSYTAHWSLNTYSITYDLDGGTAFGNPDSYTVESAAITLNEPTKAGYVFTGWSGTDLIGEDNLSVTIPAGSTGDRSYTAHWDFDPAIIAALDPTPNADFLDVSRVDWFYYDVRYVCENGLMNGTSRNRFSPYGTATRGMLVTILYRMENEPRCFGSAAFSDVKPGAYYEKAVVWASQNNIVSGYTDGTFRPDAPVTREQLASILYRYTLYRGKDVSAGETTSLTGYGDAQTVSNYALPAMRWACGTGILQGANGKLSPNGLATRAQLAAMLHRYLTK